MERLINLRKHSTSIFNQFKNAVRLVYRTIERGVDKLNLPQKLYLTSLIIMCFPDRSWLAICLLIMVGLSFEFWPRFNNIWHSLLGKSCLLFFYAIVANFALANAASVINDITGVAAEHLPYSHNFAILLYLPAWLIGFTFLALIVTALLSPFYITFILLLRPFGIKAVKAITQSNFPVLTTIARMFLSSIVMSQFIISNQTDFQVFTDKLKLSLEPIVAAAHADSLQLQLQSEQELIASSESDEKEGVTPEQGLNKKRKAFSLISIENAETANSTIVNNDEKGKVSSLRTLESKEKYISSNQKRYHHLVLYSLNLFIFELESDSRSRCKIAKGGRVIEINDFEILEISEDKTSEFGYRYTVKPCLSVGILALKNQVAN
jgi:hypothetical protein